MKRLVLAITLASLAAPPLAAAPPARQCPGLSVSCPEVIPGGAPVTFTANVDGAPAGVNPTYNWVVSAGTISSGQGTGSITVDTSGVPLQTLTATVDVGGLPAGCADSASGTVAVYRHVHYRKTDEYGDLRWGDEKARLDNFAVELRNRAETLGYMLGYGGRRSRRGEAVRRMERARRYLVTAHGLAASRIVTIDGGYREELTVELWVRGKDALPPAASPTVDPHEVRFINPARKRRARRR